MITNKIRIGIDSESFLLWGGGIDFIATITEALESTDRVSTFLLIEKTGGFELLLRYFKEVLFSKNKKISYKEWKLKKTKNIQVLIIPQLK